MRGAEVFGSTPHWEALWYSLPGSWGHHWVAGRPREWPRPAGQGTRKKEPLGYLGGNQSFGVEKLCFEVVLMVWLLT